uniref:Uncharacterized protein ycf18 n=1 Tax=Kuetzingia canaliculata TaxID=228262 RepID=A0A1Z1MPP3_KUECA|nr:phycobilisome degradation protein [Kuetzingia canaliculata]ARW67829.1 phycobilisome degradation protein [Kuetzingia canaliculata]
MKNSNKLTLEQEFKLAVYANKINEFDNERIRKYLLKILKKMMIKDNIIKYCIRNSIS